MLSIWDATWHPSPSVRLESQGSGYHMEHGHKHGTHAVGDKRLIVAIGVNAILTLAQVVGGILSGRLSLIADALHNLSDAASLVIALIARKIGRTPPDAFKTFDRKSDV